MTTDLTEQLLDAAQRLARAGLSVTPSAVAKEAGVSRATVHRRLGSQRDLLRRLVTERGVEASWPVRGEARERILDATATLVRQTGFIGCTLQDVARAADVGPATLYRLFGDRAGLLRAFAAERTPRRAARQLDPEGALQPQLERLVLEKMRFLSAHRGLLPLLVSGDSELRRLVIRPGQDPETARRALARFLAAQQERGALRAGDPQVMAYALYGALAGIALLEPDRVAAEGEAVAAELVHGFLRGWLSTGGGQG